jgi:hypothetical protein
MIRKALIAVAFVACTGLGGCGVGPWFKGNDSGGIIQWTPQTQAIWRDWAMEHCARYGKVAKLEAIHRGYGEYISFTCQFPRSGHRYVFR